MVPCGSTHSRMLACFAGAMKKEDGRPSLSSAVQEEADGLGAA